MDNTALKSIRFQGENPPGTPLDWSGVDLTHSDPYPVLTVRRDKGPAFSMVEPQQPWSWRKMLNRFDDDTLTRIIGPGVTGIFCLPMQSMAGASSYDHKREHFAKHGGVRFADAAPVPVWDFVIHRGDGEKVRLHPNQTSKKVSISSFGAPIPTAADGPQAGRGLSDFRPHARGTFQRMLAKTHTEVVPAANSVATASSADTCGDRAAPPRGDGADWRVWQDWRGAWSSDDNPRSAWSSDDNPRSAWSSDGAWHAWSSDDIDNWRGAWNSDDNWRGAWNSDGNWRGAPPAGQW